MIEKYDSDKCYYEGDIVDVCGTICKVHEFWESNCQECCFKDMENEVCQFINCRDPHISFEKLSEIETLVLTGDKNDKSK